MVQLDFFIFFANNFSFRFWDTLKPCVIQGEWKNLTGFCFTLISGNAKSLAEFKISKKLLKANLGTFSLITLVHLVDFNNVQKEETVCLLMFLVTFSDKFNFFCVVYSKKNTGKWSDKELISIPAEYCLFILLDQMWSSRRLVFNPCW